MRARRLTLGALLWLCGMVGCLALGVVAAPAAVVHEYLSQMKEVPAVGPHGEAVPFPGPLEGVDSLAGDSGNVWLAELAENTKGAQPRIDEFDASTGAFVSQLPQVPNIGYTRYGVAVGHATGEAVQYVAARENLEGESSRFVVLAFGATGGLQGTWTGADTSSKTFGCLECEGGIKNSVAVDDSTGLSDWAQGDVYVADSTDNVVDVFEPEAAGKEKLAAELAGVSPSEPFSKPGKVAVSGFNGDVLVVDRGGANIFKPAPLAGQYEFVGKLSGPPPSGSFGNIFSLAVDGSNGDIYVVEGVAGGSVVDQFSAAGAYLGQITADKTPAGSFNNLESVAVDPVTRRVFIGDYGENKVDSVVDVFGRSLVVPDVTTGTASSINAGSVTLNGTVNPIGEGGVTCQFEWGTSPAFGNVASCAAPVASGSSPVPVSSEISGLQPDTTYYYRLRASNGNGTNPGEVSQDQEVTTAGPGIRNESVSSVTASSATLDASVDPHGVATSYYFQYGTSTGYGSDVPTSPGTALGSGTAVLEVGQHLQGLSPSTVYHFRVVTVGELAPGVFEAFDGPDQTFTTQTGGEASVLPDGRAWEMVSPPDKHGALIYAIGQYGGEPTIMQAAAAGNAIAFITDAPTEGQPKGFSNLLNVLAVRGAAGWSSQDIAPPHGAATGPSVGQGQEYRFFSEDLSLGAVQPFGRFTSLSDEASEQTPYLHTDFSNGDVGSPCVSPCYRPLVTSSPGHADVPSGTVFGEEAVCVNGGIYCGPEFVDATSDLSHVVLRSHVALTSTPTGGRAGLYEWSAGKLALINVLPGGEASAEAHLGESDSHTRHAISDDGSRVIWSGTYEGENHLFMRDVGLGQTVQLDAVQGGSAGGKGIADFQAASSDGSKVFFLDTERLTADSGARSFPDLYKCTMVVEAGVLKCKLSDVTPLRSGESANVRGLVLGASEDGSYVYFAANGIIPGAGPAVHGTCKGETQSECNLYIWHDGVTRLVTILSGGDQNDWNNGLSASPVRVSPDGRWLAFMSQRALTGYDNRDAVSGQPDQEVYLYDAGSGKLVCASCNPTGARPVGVEINSSTTLGIAFGGTWVNSTWLAATIPAWTPYVKGARYQSRYLSDSGRLFFNSSDALVPLDVNGTEDVYEFEPPGVGDCSSASATFSVRSGGCVSLISSGGSSEESAFLDASTTGGDVFFLTSAKLSGQDFDTAVDLYDAHECSTGSPCVSAPVAEPPVCDTGDACKAAPSPQPVAFGAPSSATFTGAGNVVLPGSKAAVGAKGLTRAQKLARALRVCVKKRRGRPRTVCRQRARQRYATNSSSRATAIGKGGR